MLWPRSGVKALLLHYDPIAPPRVGRALAGGSWKRGTRRSHASHGLPILDPGRINGLLLDHLGTATAGIGARSSSPF